MATNGNVVEVVGEDHVATLYIFIACGVLIVCGSAVCCLGIYVHYTSKRRHVKELHGDELEMHKAMSRSPRSFASPRSLVSRHSESGGLYATVPIGAHPEPDGFMASQMTVPRRQRRAIFQENPRRIAVNSAQDAQLDEIQSVGHSERLRGVARRAQKKKRQRRRQAQREEEEEEDSDSNPYDLASCSSRGGVGDGKADAVRTMHQGGASSTAVAAYARAQSVCRGDLGVPPPPVASPTHVPPYLSGVSDVLVRDENQ